MLYDYFRLTPALKVTSNCSMGRKLKQMVVITLCLLVNKRRCSNLTNYFINKNWDVKLVCHLWLSDWIQDFHIINYVDCFYSEHNSLGIFGKTRQRVWLTELEGSHIHSSTRKRSYWFKAALCWCDVAFLSMLWFASTAKEVTYLCPFSGPVRGVLQITNYRLHFKADDVRIYT